MKIRKNKFRKRSSIMWKLRYNKIFTFHYGKAVNWIKILIEKEYKFDRCSFQKIFLDIYIYRINVTVKKM